MKPSDHLNRYTTLPVLLDLLKRKKLVLLDPATWEDRNDSEVMLEYKRRKKSQSLLALCFSHGSETIHHWKTFADGISGCCIEFSRKSLIEHIKMHPGVRYRDVTYRKLKDLKGGTIRLNDMPFTKRWPYRCEEEFRIIWEGDTATTYYEIPFDLKLINKITISQRMPKQVYSTILKYLKTAFNNPDQRINRSTLYENKTWIDKFKQA